MKLHFHENIVILESDLPMDSGENTRDSLCINTKSIQLLLASLYCGIIVLSIRAMYGISKVQK